MKKNKLFFMFFAFYFLSNNLLCAINLDTLNKVDQSYLFRAKSGKSASNDTIIKNSDSTINAVIKLKSQIVELNEKVEDEMIQLEDENFDLDFQKILNKNYQNVFENLALLEKIRSDSIMSVNLKKEIELLNYNFQQDSINISSKIEDKIFVRGKDKNINQIKLLYNKILDFSQLDEKYKNQLEKITLIESSLKNLEKIRIGGDKLEKKIDLNILINEIDTIREHQFKWNTKSYTLTITDLRKYKLNQSFTPNNFSKNEDYLVINKKMKPFFLKSEDTRKNNNLDEILYSIRGKVTTVSNFKNPDLGNKFISWFDNSSNLFLSLNTQNDNFNNPNLHSLIEYLEGYEIIVTQINPLPVNRKIIKKIDEENKSLKDAIYNIDNHEKELSKLKLNTSEESNKLTTAKKELENLNTKISSYKEDLFSIFSKSQTVFQDSTKFSKISPPVFQEWLNSVLKYSSDVIKSESKAKIKESEYKKLLNSNTSLKSKQNNNAVTNLEIQLSKFLNSKEKLPLLVNIEVGRSKYRVLLIDPTKNAIHLHNNSSGALAPLGDSWQYYLKEKKIKPFAIVNAGMYEINGSAKGLLIENKILKNKIDLIDKGSGNFYMQPNGIFYQDLKGQFGILDTKTFNSKYEFPKGRKNQEVSTSLNFATQSGPMLLNNNVINSQFIFNSQNINIRNGVGISTKWKRPLVIMVISDTKVNFYDFAFLYKSVLGCENALYLDGAISKMYIKGEKNKDLSGELGPKLLVTEK